MAKTYSLHRLKHFIALIKGSSTLIFTHFTLKLMFKIYFFDHSKTLNRLISLMPEGSSANFVVEPEDKAKLGANALNEYKSEYIKQFNDANRGLVDTYSMSKGGVLLKIDEQQKSDTSRFDSQSELKLVGHDQDFRSVWIPKKFEGRNMFASHIGSAIFPEKRE